MSNETQFVAALQRAGGALCDDCITPLIGWNQRQQANQVGKRLAHQGRIARGKGECAQCKKWKIVSRLPTHDLGSQTASARHAELGSHVAPQPTLPSQPRHSWSPKTADFSAALSALFVDAEREGRNAVIVTSGELHKRVGGYPGPSHRMPVCCGAMRAAMVAGDQVLDEPPSGMGASLKIRYSLPRRSDVRGGRVQVAPPAVASRPAEADVSPARPAEPQRRAGVAPRTPLSGPAASRIGLVGCVKKKRDSAAPAQELYTSPLFRLRRQYVERSCGRWLILSALHGVVRPDAVIAPYDVTLNDASLGQRREWATMVLKQLEDELGTLTGLTFAIHAGANYAEYGLVTGLQKAGAIVEQPVRGLALGQQLAFYNTALREDRADE